MDVLEFNEVVRYTPNLAHVPEAWQDQSFKSLDFTGKEKLKALLLRYLEEFDLEGCDSLVAFPSDFAYSIIVSIYIEVSKRVSVDHYMFVHWNEFMARIQGFGYAGEENLMNALFAKKYIFLFDLTMADNYRKERFVRIMDYCYLNKVRLLIATRLAGNQLGEIIPEEYRGMYESKVAALEIK
jgi:hypothetical protein